MLVYQLNSQGIFVGTTAADPDPLTPGEHLIPAGCVTVAPPAIPDDKLAWWVDEEWHLIDPPEDGEEPEIPTLQSAKAAKAREVDRWVELQLATVTWDGNIYQTDPTARERLMAELMMVQLDHRASPSPWRTYSNDMVLLTNEQFTALCKAVRDAHQTILLTSFAHKDAIASLEAIADVEAYEIS